MGIWSLLGGMLGVAIGVVQLVSGDWRGALWSVLGVGLMYARAHRR